MQNCIFTRFIQCFVAIIQSDIADQKQIIAQTNHLQNKPNKAHRHKRRPARNTSPARIEVTTSRLELKNSQEIVLFCFKIGYFYIYLRQIRQRPNRIQLPKRRNGRTKVIENQHVRKFSKPRNYIHSPTFHLFAGDCFCYAKA